MAVRRSARLRSAQSPVEDTPADSTKQNNMAKNKSKKNLDPVMEREEPVATPAENQSTPAKAHTPKSAHSQKKSPAKTPSSALTRPTHFEMHPSKAHQSTTKQADSGLILGFNPVKKDAQGNVVKENPAQNTPSKTNASPASAYYGTPAFDFKFCSQDSQLSDEAKKLMESVREDVARIKANMVHEQASAPNTAGQERKIAKPKGKAKRFSDVHMADFKKMDSIAGHASAFRAEPGRFQPVIEKSLKRTNSKARLNESEGQNSPARSQKESTPTTPSAKRVKQDKPSATPQGRLPSAKSAVSRARHSIRSSLLTPTRSSMARASGSLKPPRTTMIPFIARSPLSKPDAPSTPRTEFNPRFKSNIPTLSSLKSILRRPQPLFSKDPAKIAAGTHQAAPDFTPELLLQPSRESSPAAAVTPSPKKRVEFTPCTKPRGDMNSPSPSKIPTTITYPSTSDVLYPALPTLTPERSRQSPAVTRPSEPAEVDMPEVPGMPHGLSHKKKNRATEDKTGGQKAAPALSLQSSHVSAEDTQADVPGMPHGLSHKKRHRATKDDTDRENVPPNDEPSQERSVKRVKMNAEPYKPMSSPLKSRSNTPSRPNSVRKNPASARRSRVLSMSRLNMLAQPKNRS